MILLLDVVDESIDHLDDIRKFLTLNARLGHEEEEEVLPQTQICEIQIDCRGPICVGSAHLAMHYEKRIVPLTEVTESA